MQRIRIAMKGAQSKEGSRRTKKEMSSLPNITQGNSNKSRAPELPLALTSATSIRWARLVRKPRKAPIRQKIKSL
jgi:hypothetical protein